uniref:Uncharacterized protein n=1 Tax=Timema poppense TaxID=170557 RepID=A0A7R9CYT3_TIMPO|nr:unnamed protein product [Timema poppensis]
MINGLVAKPALQEVQVFKKRWLMLLLFVICSTCNAAHWVQFSIISNIVTRYYGVSTLAIDWTSMVYMAAYIPLVLPAAWLLDKKVWCCYYSMWASGHSQTDKLVQEKMFQMYLPVNMSAINTFLNVACLVITGLRLTLICGAIFMTAGSWIKVASVSPDRFYVAFIGQIFVGAAQIFILGVPARLAAVWFGPTQVSTATSIGVFGNQKAPPVPPSPAQASIKCQEDKSSYVKSLKALAGNKNFLLLLASYGINVGVFYAVSTLLNQVLLLHFKRQCREVNGRSSSARFEILSSTCESVPEQCTPLSTFSCLASRAVRTSDSTLVYIMAGLYSHDTHFSAFSRAGTARATVLSLSLPGSTAFLSTPSYVRMRTTVKYHVTHNNGGVLHGSSRDGRIHFYAPTGLHFSSLCHWSFLGANSNLVPQAPVIHSAPPSPHHNTTTTTPPPQHHHNTTTSHPILCLLQLLPDTPN